MVHQELYENIRGDKKEYIMLYLLVLSAHIMFIFVQMYV